MFIEIKKTLIYFKYLSTISHVDHYYQVADTIKLIDIFVIAFSCIVLLVKLSN